VKTGRFSDNPPKEGCIAPESGASPRTSTGPVMAILGQAGELVATIESPGPKVD
jgi:hypothetical protein